MSDENRSSWRGSDGLQDYFKSIVRFPLITREEEIELGRQYKETGNKRFRDKLIVSNLRFVVNMAMKYAGYGFNVLDLIQEGNNGLTLASEKWNPDNGSRLVIYAGWYIRAYIHEYIMANWSLVKIGTTAAQRKIFHRLMSSKWNNKDDEGILSGVDGSSAEELNEVKYRVGYPDLSLDTPMSDVDGGSSLHDVVADEGATDQEDVVIRANEEVFFAHAVELAVKFLEDREQIIIRGRFLHGNRQMLGELGNKLGISKERIRQLEVGALEQMREFFAQGRNTKKGEELRELLGGGVFKNIKPPTLTRTRTPKLG